jgi:uncharacterized protein
MPAENVAALLKSPIGSARTIQIDEPQPELGPEISVGGPLRGSARLMRTQDGVLAQCDATAAVEVECGRCLEPIATDVHIQFVEEFLPAINVVTGLPAEPPEDEALQIDEHHILDLGETIRQFILTNLPLKPICQAACRGLCPECGTNLNTEECSCAEDANSGPLGNLAQLLGSTAELPGSNRPASRRG